MVILFKMTANHLTDGDDDQRLPPILMAIQSQKRAVRGIDPLEPAGQTANQRMAVFQEVVIGGGGVQAALRI